VVLGDYVRTVVLGGVSGKGVKNGVRRVETKEQTTRMRGGEKGGVQFSFGKTRRKNRRKKETLI